MRLNNKIINNKYINNVKINFIYLNIVDDELVFNDVEMLCADDSNDLNMDDEVTTSKESLPVKFKRKVNQKLRMKGDPYLGYSWSKSNQVLHNVDRVGKNIRLACNNEVCKKSQKRKCNEITEVDRLRIFNNFWKNMNWDEKKKRM